MNARILTVRYEGRVYRIPEAWMVGACRTLGSFWKAAACWHEQAMMQEGR